METTVKTEEVMEELRRLYFEVAGVWGKLEGQNREAARSCLSEAHRQLSLAYKSFLKDKR